MSKKSETQSLEDYLNQIAHELRDLPSQARADEMREIEAHLRTMIETRGENATAEALAQFGKPRRVGHELRKAWERKQPEAWWRAGLAPIAVVMFCALTWLVLTAFPIYFPDTPEFLSFPFYVYAPLLCGSLITFFAGFIAGIVSPKRGIVLTSVVCSFYLVIMILSVAELSVTAKLTGLIVVIPWICLAPMCWAGTRFGARCDRKLSARTNQGDKPSIQIADAN